MRVLIVGCGYLGELAGRYWQEQGAQILAMTRSPARARAFLERGWTPILADVLEPGRLRTLPDADVLLYAVGFDRSSGHDKRAVYVSGLGHVLDAVQGRTGRIVYVSSTSVYGQSRGELVDENSPAEATTENGRICLDAEARFSAAVAAGADGVILRLAGLYGPGRLLARCDSLRAGEPLSGTGDAWLNLIHQDDAARLAMLVAARGTSGRLYLGADCEPVRRREFYGRLAELLGAPTPRFADDASGGRDGDNGGSPSLESADRKPAAPNSASGQTDAGAAPAAGASTHGKQRGEGLSKRCHAARIRQELGFRHAFPSYREGLLQSLRGTE